MNQPPKGEKENRKMIKRVAFWVVTALILSAASVRAQQPTFSMIANPCIGTANYGNAQACYDSGTHQWYHWNGTGWLVSGSEMFTGGTTAVFSQVAAEAFTPISGNSIATLVAATEGDAMQAVNAIATCKNLYCYSTNIAGTLTAAGGTSWTIAVDDNTVATALTCTITAALTSCKDTTHTFTTAIGDLLDYGWTPAGTPTAIVPHCVMECDQ